MAKGNRNLSARKNSPEEGTGLDPIQHDQETSLVLSTWGCWGSCVRSCLCNWLILLTEVAGFRLEAAPSVLGTLPISGSRCRRLVLEMCWPSSSSKGAGSSAATFRRPNIRGKRYSLAGMSSRIGTGNTTPAVCARGSAGQSATDIVQL